MTQPDQLSDREWEVVKLVLEGKSNKQIASSLHISERTVEFHLTNIYSKLQVGSRTELIVKLGESTVAGKGEFSENKGQPDFQSWAASLRGVISNKVKELKMESSLNATADQGSSRMTFFDAIRICLTKYADFEGRASRPEFWWFALFVTLVASALVYVSEVLASVFLIALLLPFLAVGARRLRDIGKSSWWPLFLLVPVGGIVVLGFMWALPPVSPLPETA